jgi:hypothetical protein
MTTNHSQKTTGLTLTQATEFGRKGLVMGGVLIITYLVLRMLFNAAVSYYRAMNPVPPPPPTVGFGRLPALVFPEQELAVWPKKMILEPAQGKLPQFADRAKVFAMHLSTPNLLADEAVRQVARTYGFISQPEILNPNKYRWIKYQPLETVLEINLINLNFSLKSDYQTRPELVTANSLPEKHEAVQSVKAYLRKSDYLPDDIATAAGEVSYIKVLAGEILPAVSLSDANFVQVDLNRVPIDGQIEMYTPKGKIGVVSAIISGALETQEQIVQLDYHNQLVNYESVHTYPLKSVNTAWKELVNQQGYVASGEKLDQAVIRNAVLGYFDSFEDQSFLQPVYVFIGDNDFLGYVPAVESSYTVN